MESTEFKLLPETITLDIEDEEEDLPPSDTDRPQSRLDSSAVSHSDGLEDVAARPRSNKRRSACSPSGSPAPRHRRGSKGMRRQVAESENEDEDEFLGTEEE
jgi:hypothetical protein